MRLHLTGDAPFSYCDNFAGGGLNEPCNLECQSTGSEYFESYSLLDSASGEYNVVRNVSSILYWWFCNPSVGFLSISDFGPITALLLY